MRKAFLLSFAANLILLVVSFAVSPPRVAIHFGFGGFPDNWGPPYVNALIMGGVNVLLFVSLWFLPVLVRRLPAKYINLPNKGYWSRDENKERTILIFSREMHLFGVAVFIFMFVVALLALQANLSTPVKLREDLFFGALALFMIFMIYWSIRLIRKFRIPAKAAR